MAFKMAGFSAFTKPKLPGKKKITKELGLFGDIKRFVKGARTETGTYNPDTDVTAEKGKRVTYTPQGDTYIKVVQKKKKGSVSGNQAWEQKRIKEISKKKAQKQIKRKTKRFNK